MYKRQVRQKADHIKLTPHTQAVLDRLSISQYGEDRGESLYDAYVEKLADIYQQNINVGEEDVLQINIACQGMNA